MNFKRCPASDIVLTTASDIVLTKTAMNDSLHVALLKGHII